MGALCQGCLSGSAFYRLLKYVLLSLACQESLDVPAKSRTRQTDRVCQSPLAGAFLRIPLKTKLGHSRTSIRLVGISTKRQKCSNCLLEKSAVTAY